MTQNRFYSSLSLQTTITDNPLTNVATTINIAAASGLPASFPYTMLIDWGTANAEIVKVTARSGTILTVVRGQDGTSAVSHSVGTVIVHGVSQQDFNEPQVHMDSTAAHGATGAVVGTSNAQTLTNKTLTSPAINNPTGIVKADVGLANVDNTSDAAVAIAVQTLTNKTLTSPTINNAVMSTPTGIVKSDVGLGNVDNTSDATKNAASVTLTNKTLTSPVVNTPTGITKSDVGLSLVDNTSDATKNAAIATLTNKTMTTPVLNSPTINTPSGLTKSDVGLGSVDNTSDATKNAATVTLTNKTLTSPIIASIVNVGTLTLPATTDTLVGRATTDTLTNKTLTLPVITSISNTGTVTIPTGTRTLVARDTTDTLTNKTLTAPVLTSPTGIAKADVGLGNVDNTSNATERAAAATLSNKTITSPVITSPTGLVKGDVGLGLVDNTSDNTKNSASVTLTNKTLTGPVINGFSGTGNASITGNLSVTGNIPFGGTGVGHMRVITKAIATARTSTTTLANDPHLTFTVVAGGQYIIESNIQAQGATAGDIKIAWVLPSAAPGSDGLRSCYGPAVGSTDRLDTTVSTQVVHFTTAVSYGLSSTSAGNGIIETGYVTVDTSGSMTLQWAQGTSSATATTVYETSYIKVIRVA